MGGPLLHRIGQIPQYMLKPRAWVVELEEEADLGGEQRDLLVHVDEAAAVHDAEAGEDEHRHQQEQDQEE